MKSNLPPGVSDSDIPGNRPEDQEWDCLWDWLADVDISPVELQNLIYEWAQKNHRACPPGPVYDPEEAEQAELMADAIDALEEQDATILDPEDLPDPDDLEEARHHPVFEKKIQVYCDTCGMVDEKSTEFIDIEEDIQGADILTFKCPECGTKQKSRRYG